jgi:DNA-binding NtrC family response regulator
LVADNSISKSKLVAIVDDEDDIAKLFRDALGTINGITIFAFTDPVMALEHFKLNKENYVLVIYDIWFENARSYRNVINKEIKKCESICKNSTNDRLHDKW